MMDNEQLPKGYKNTEVGVIPEDWEVKKLGDIGENIIGLTYSPNDVKSYGHLVLRSSNIQNNKLAFENNVFVEMELPNRVIVKENDILICVRNGSKHLIGKCALIDKATEGSAFGAFMSVYRTKNAEFIFHQFQSNIIQKQIDEVMGATINQLTNKDLSTFQIPLPKEDKEQTAIATALSDADALINSLEQLIAKKRNIKQGAMQKLLQPKEDWEVKKLGEVIYLQGGYAFKSELFTNVGIPIIRISDVGNNKVDTENSVCYEPFNIPKEFVAKKGDILIAMSGATTGKIGVYYYDGIAYINQRVGKFVVLNETSQEFISHIVRSEKFKENLTKEIAQGAQPNISGKQIQSIVLPIPNDKEEQIRIATILSDMDADIQALETKLEKYRKIKLGMMQNLLTGKIRLV